jgi:hypothetical protein
MFLSTHFWVFDNNTNIVLILLQSVFRVLFQLAGTRAEVLRSRYYRPSTGIVLENVEKPSV